MTEFKLDKQVGVEVGGCGRQGDEITVVVRAYFSVQLITICTDFVKSKCAVEKGNVCTKKCRDSGQNDDLRADCQVLPNC